MIFTETKIPGVFVIELEQRRDERGFFARQWCADEFTRAGLDPRVAQINTAHSVAAGTLRGVHYQKAPRAEVKLVRCTRGAVFDVAVDLRAGSATFCQWFGPELAQFLKGLDLGQHDHDRKSRIGDRRHRLPGQSLSGAAG